MKRSNSRKLKRLAAAIKLTLAQIVVTGLTAIVRTKPR
jgi:hypothetical protein